jgi:hypothetical protein
VAVWSSTSVPVNPAWLAWHGGAAVKRAHLVYEERELPASHLDAARLFGPGGPPQAGRGGAAG